MGDQAKLVKITVIENASQDNVTGRKNWVAVKSDKAYATLEATTAPQNNPDEWKQIRWNGGEAVSGQPRRRRVSLAASKKYHVDAQLGGVSDFVDLWVVWASIEILTTGIAPTNAAHFDKGSRDNSPKLGAVTYETVTSSVIDEENGVFVQNVGASGKVAPVATLTPKGIAAVLKSGWTFERDAWSRNWVDDGHEAPGTNKTWTRDTSKPQYLKLTPDTSDKIYDLDGPDLRWGAKNWETYNNFRQWIEWNKTVCSDFALWHWNARWVLNKDPKKQIPLKDVGPGNPPLPSGPFFK